MGYVGWDSLWPFTEATGVPSCRDIPKWTWTGCGLKICPFRCQGLQLSSVHHTTTDITKAYEEILDIISP